MVVKVLLLLSLFGCKVDANVGQQEVAEAYSASFTPVLRPRVDRGTIQYLQYGEMTFTVVPDSLTVSKILHLSTVMPPKSIYLLVHGKSELL